MSSLEALVANGTLSRPAADLLTLDVWAKGSMLISGGPGSGKSTLLGAVLATARDDHNVHLCEELAEVAFQSVAASSEIRGRERYQAIPPGPWGQGGRSLQDLVRLTARTRPDVLAVGEVRGQEPWELARASRAGAGWLTTILASSAEDGLEALVLTALGAGPDITENRIRRTFARSLDLVVHMERHDPHLVRDNVSYRVREIRAVAPVLGNALHTEPIFERNGGPGSPLTWTGQMPATTLLGLRLERLLPEGATLPEVLLGRAGL